MKRIPLLILFALTLALGIGFTACSDLSTKATSVASVASQASGAVQGLVGVAMAAPVDDATKDQIAVYGRWATLATDAVSGVSTALTASDAVKQATGTVQAINTIVQRAPIDSGTKEKVGGWSDWALIALKAAATILPMVIGDSGGAGGMTGTCGSCHVTAAG